MMSDEAYKIIQTLPEKQRYAVGRLMRECLLVGRDYGWVSDKPRFHTEAAIAKSEFSRFERDAEVLIGGEQ